MRIEKKNFGLNISNVACGDCFVTLRSGRNNDKIGCYMKIDKDNGFFPWEYSEDPFYLAVNLETGQLRKFSSDVLVCPFDAKIVC